MNSQKILAFSDFLAREPKSYNAIAQYLVMNTFSDQKFICIYIGELIETGVVCPLAGFGWSSEEYAALTDLPIHDKYPVTDAIRENRILISHNNDEFKTEYPLMTTSNFTAPWNSAIAIPVYPIGGMAMFTSLELKLTEQLNVFYIAIGSLLGLYASRLPAALVEVAINVKQKIDLPQIPLTGRQLVIADLLERGFNNAQIGLELGFSESLIRQETVAIYRKLQVSGRKAMQAISALRLDSVVLDDSDVAS
jgi:DNA-binding CsgD family transcriptional regulator